MKYLLTVFISIFATATLASETSPIRLPIGAKLAKPAVKVGRTTTATMTCELFSTVIENDKFKESTLLATQKSQPFDLGISQFTNLSYPAPYQDVTVFFNYFFISYGENPKIMSYVQSFFMNKDQSAGDLKDASFDIDAQSDSKVLLRGVYVYSDSAMLTNQCSIEILK